MMMGRRFECGSMFSWVRLAWLLACYYFYTALHCIARLGLRLFGEMDRWGYFAMVCFIILRGRGSLLFSLFSLLLRESLIIIMTYFWNETKDSALRSSALTS